MLGACPVKHCSLFQFTCLPIGRSWEPSPLLSFQNLLAVFQCFIVFKPLQIQIFWAEFLSLCTVHLQGLIIFCCVFVVGSGGEGAVLGTSGHIPPSSTHNSPRPCQMPTGGRVAGKNTGSLLKCTFQIMNFFCVSRYQMLHGTSVLQILPVSRPRFFDFFFLNLKFQLDVLCFYFLNCETLCVRQNCPQLKATDEGQQMFSVFI